MGKLGEGYAEVEAFIADAHRILEEHGGPNEAAFEAIGRRMQPLAKRTDLEDLRDGAPLPGNWIYSEPDGLTLMLSTFPTTTAVHTHGAWGVMVGYKGTERYRQWVREDDGSVPGKATLRLLREIEVKPGDFGWWYPPPSDIHQQVPDEGGVLELILMGNPPTPHRLYFNPDAGTYEEGEYATRHYKQ